MKVMKTVIQIAILFLFYYIGVWLQQALHLFIPGSVIGLALMFLCLLTGVMRVSWIQEGAGFMVTHLALFFIPATVGILNYYDLFVGKGVLLIVITIISSLLVMGSAGFISEKIATKGGKNEWEKS